MSEEIDRAPSVPHDHTSIDQTVTHDDEHGTRTVYTCACGATRAIERFPAGCWRTSEWSHLEAVRAG